MYLNVIVNGTKSHNAAAYTVHSVHTQASLNKWVLWPMSHDHVRMDYYDNEPLFPLGIKGMQILCVKVFINNVTVVTYI